MTDLPGKQAHSAWSAQSLARKGTSGWSANWVGLGSVGQTFMSHRIACSPQGPNDHSGSGIQAAASRSARGLPEGRGGGDEKV